MILTHYYFDCRRPDKQGRGQVRLVISKNGTRAVISTGIKLLPSEWEKGIVVRHPNAGLLNNVLNIKKANIDRFILEQSIVGNLAGKKANELVKLITEEFDPEIAQKKKECEERKNSLPSFLDQLIKTKKNKGTKQLYKDTYNILNQYCEYAGIDFRTLSFSAIDESWLTSFEAYCRDQRHMKVNSSSRHLRDIRHTFKSAINAGLTTNYPFHQFKITHELGRDKSFTAEELRILFNYPCYPGGQQEAVDMFKLMFCLIGINPIDLANAGKPHRGRLEYVRAKTQKPYSIKLEPEALAIINQYTGKDMLVNILDRVTNSATYFNRLGKNLKQVGLERVPGKKNIGVPLLDDICLGSARTSWATIAQEELGFNREDIAAALGHHTVDVTTHYLRTKWKNIVDQRNREMLDYVFYGKRPEATNNLTL